MKKLLALSIALPALASTFFCASVLAQPKLTPLWKTSDLPTPESVLYVADKKSPYLFVSLIDGEGAAVDGKGGIATLTPSGEVIKKDWVIGLNAPKGMALVQNHLYVSDITEVVVIDIKNKKIVKRIPIEGSTFLNDVTADSSGVVYVSDTQTNKVYRIKDDKPELYLDKVNHANGLAAIGSDLLVGAGAEMLSVDANKKSKVVAKDFPQGIDGIEMVKPGEYLVSSWAGLVYYVHANGKFDVLIDSQADKINTADIGFDPASKTLFVPNFFKNSVTAYRLE